MKTFAFGKEIIVNPTKDIENDVLVKLSADDGSMIILFGEFTVSIMNGDIHTSQSKPGTKK